MTSLGLLNDGLLLLGHIFGIVMIFSFISAVEFWKKVPPNQPYRVILSDVRDKLYNTREQSRELLSSGHSDIPEEATLTTVEQVEN